MPGGHGASMWGSATVSSPVVGSLLQVVRSSCWDQKVVVRRGIGPFERIMMIQSHSAERRVLCAQNAADDD